MHDGEGEIADARGLRAVGNSPRHRDPYDAATAQRLLRVIACLGFDPIDLAAGRELLRRKGATGDQAAAAHADEQEIEWPGLLEQFLGHGALPRNHVGIVEGHHQRRATLGDDAAGDRLAILALPVVGNNAPRAVTFSGLPLDRRCIPRHHDGRADAQQPRRQGHGLRMVAGREGHGAGLALLRQEAAQRVVGATELECPRPLEVLTLEVNLCTQRPVGLLGSQHRRAVRDARETLGGGCDVGIGDVRHLLLL